MTRLVIITGPPGAGKTTISKAVADALPLSACLHADDFWHYVRSGFVEPWLEESRRQNEVVMTAVAAAATTYCNGGYDVVLDGIVGPWLLAPFLERTEARGIDLHYMVLRPDVETALSRAVSRLSEKALVEREPILHMYREFAALGDYERHTLDSSNMTAAATVAAVLERLSQNCGRRTSA